MHVLRFKVGSRFSDVGPKVRVLKAHEDDLEDWFDEACEKSDYTPSQVDAVEVHDSNTANNGAPCSKHAQVPS